MVGRVGEALRQGDLHLEIEALRGAHRRYDLDHRGGVGDGQQARVPPAALGIEVQGDLSPERLPSRPQGRLVEVVREAVDHAVAVPVLARGQVLDPAGGGDFGVPLVAVEAHVHEVFVGVHQFAGGRPGAGAGRGLPVAQLVRPGVHVWIAVVAVGVEDAGDVSVALEEAIAVNVQLVRTGPVVATVGVDAVAVFVRKGVYAGVFVVAVPASGPAGGGRAVDDHVGVAEVVSVFVAALVDFPVAVVVAPVAALDGRRTTDSAGVGLARGL